jgi:hypothetical protein
MRPRTHRYRAEQYIWLLTADPPICRAGRPIEVLNSCERRRRDEVCWCRVAVRDVVDDLELVGRPDLGEWFESELEADDVADLAERLHAIAPGNGDDAALERVMALANILRRVADHGSGLTDRYADDVDP